MNCKSCNDIKIDSTKFKFFSYCPYCGTVYDKYIWIFNTSYFLNVWMVVFAAFGMILSILPGIIRESIFGFPEELRYAVFNAYMNSHQNELLIIRKITMILFTLWVLLFIVWFIGIFPYDYLKTKSQEEEKVNRYIKLIRKTRTRKCTACNFTYSALPTHNELKLSFIIALVMFVLYAGMIIILEGQAYL